MLVEPGPEGKKFGKATGFAVKEDRILTCAHVLKGASNVKVRFIDASRTEWLDAKPLWSGEATTDRQTSPDKIDAAVLAVDAERVKALIGSNLESVLAYSTPLDRDEWCSRGMLRGSEIKDAAKRPISEAIDFGGKLYCPDGRGVMTLDADCSPADPHDWQGGSGSPVFANDRLVGVLSSWPSAWAGEKLKAVWVGRLWGEPDFYIAVGLADQGKRYDELRGKIGRKLNDSANRPLCTELAGCLNLSQQEGNGVTHYICGLTSLDLLRLGNHVFGRLLNKEITCDELSDLQLAKILEEIVEELMPWGTRPEVYSMLRRSEKTSPPAYLLLPCASVSVAEIYLARLDERFARFKPAFFNGVAVGEFSAPFDPDVGFGANPDQRTRMLLADLGRAYGINIKSMTTMELKEMARPVNAAVEELVHPRYGEPALCPYLVFHRVEDQASVEALKRLLPALRVCRIEPDRYEDDEAKLCAQLKEFANLKARRDALLKDRKA